MTRRAMDSSTRSRGPARWWGSARVIKVLVVVAIVSMAFSAIWIQTASAALSPWSGTTNYPLAIYGQRCVVSSGFVFCVGGITDDPATGNGKRVSAVFFAAISSSGVGPWSASTNYPLVISGHDCIANSGFVYCIGGDTDDPNNPSGRTLSDVYFAPLSPSGVGSWSATTNYPTIISAQSCVASSGFVYCIGGSVVSSATNAVYFAALSSNGLGPWSATTNYPTSSLGQSCVVSSEFVYCIGGTGSVVGTLPMSAVYFATVSSSGVGPWSATADYPIFNSHPACVATSGSVYCIGAYRYNGDLSNATYFAALSSSGVGAWNATTNYPTTIITECVARAGFVYCIGGYNRPTFISAVYFASVTQVTQNVTSTAVTCSPSYVAVGQPAQCSATVTDTSATPISPEGTVAFSSNSSGSFAPSNTCELSSINSSTASCSSKVSYTPSPSAEGAPTITGIYSGEPAHQGSSGTTSLTVEKRTSSTTVNCSKVKGNIVCTVTVTDTSPGTPMTPTGTVSMSSTGTGTLTSCALSGIGSSGTCTVTYTPGKGKTSTVTITGTYPGDVNHLGSSGSTTIRSF